MSEAHYSISSEGVGHLKRWETARRYLERLKQQVTTAEWELANAQNALGKWMVPADSPAAGEGDRTGPDPMEEHFNIWVGNGLLFAKKVGQNDYEVRWRKAPTEGPL